MISNSGTTSLGLYDFKRQIDAFGGVDYFRPTLAGGYLPNARVMLNNGDIVKSTIDGNTNDPNSDMTGWVKTNSASQIFDESGLSQQEINNNLIGDNGSKFINLTLSNLANVVKKSLYDVVYDQLIDVTWFGAVGNWNKDTQTGHNSTVAVQNAIAYLATLGTRRQGGKRGLKFPKGSFRVDYMDLVAALGFGIDVIGEGVKTTNIYFDQNQNRESIRCEIEFCQFRDISLIGSLNESAYGGNRTTAGFVGKLPNNYPDIDVTFFNCEIVQWGVFAKIHGRGCIFESCMLGVMTSAMEIVCDDSIVHGASSNLMQATFATMRHYTFRNCRFDTVSRAYTVTGSGYYLDHINNLLFVGNDMTSMDRLIDAPLATFNNSVIACNTALSSFTTTAFIAAAFNNTIIANNPFCKSLDFDNTPSTSLTTTEYIVDTTKPCKGMVITGNVFRSLTKAIMRNTAASESSGISITNNHLNEFGSYKGGNSTISVYLGSANCKGLVITGNNFQSSVVSGTYYLHNFNGHQKAEDVIFSNNYAPFKFLDILFSFTPTVYVNGVITAGTHALKTGRFFVEGDFVIGKVYLSGTIPETTGSITISLPSVLAIADFLTFGSFYSGVSNMETAVGFLSAGYSFANGYCTSTQRIELKKQKDLSIINVDAADVPATYSAVISFKYRFK